MIHQSDYSHLYILLVITTAANFLTLNRSIEGCAYKIRKFSSILHDSHLAFLFLQFYFFQQENAGETPSSCWISRIRDDIDRSGFGFLWTGLKPRCAGETTVWNRSTLSGQGIVVVGYHTHIYIFIFERIRPVCISINFHWISRTLVIYYLHIIIGWFKYLSCNVIYTYTKILLPFMIDCYI